MAKYKVKMNIYDPNEKITNIKFLRKFAGLGLREAKAVVDNGVTGYTVTFLINAEQCADLYAIANNWDFEEDGCMPMGVDTVEKIGKDGMIDISGS